MLSKGTRILLVMLLGLGILQVSAYGANVVFSDDFEGVAPGSLPDASKWVISGGAAVFVADDYATPDGTQVARFPTSGGSTMRTIIADPPTDEFWVELYLDPDGSFPGTSLALWKSGALISLTLIIYDLGNGYYCAWVNSGNGTDWIITTGDPSPQVGMEQWVLGVVTTNSPSPGSGLYSIYRDGVPLVSDVAFDPVSSGAVPNEAVIYDQADNQLVFDAVKVYDGNPVQAVPENCGDPGTEYKVSDINQDCYVNLADFARIATLWLDCTNPGDVNCN